MKSCIYRGVVRHRRHEPVEHAFDYPLFMMYLDLAELPDVFDAHWLWSAERPAPAWFRRSDYLGDSELDLDVAVRDEAERLTGDRPSGPIRMLTHLRYFGYVQNPVTFYYCFRPESEEVETVVAEITNTPWGERHAYALRSSDPHAPVCGRTHRFRKSFHVSPFMDMDQEYEWRFGRPGPRLSVHMRNRVDGGRIFDAALALRREEITSGSLARALARFPWMTARVVGGIYWQAFRLWVKRAPYYEHPARRAA
ncbi:MAG: DUF1365 domain-containing protein [Gemmatimonadota bacterium]